MNNYLYEVEAATEAARQWGLDESTVRKKCEHEGTQLEWRNSGRIKLVTRKSMDLEFGTILQRILKGGHRDPFYGCEILIMRGEYSKEELLKAGVPISVLNGVNVK